MRWPLPVSVACMRLRPFPAHADRTGDDRTIGGREHARPHQAQQRGVHRQVGRDHRAGTDQSDARQLPDAHGAIVGSGGGKVKSVNEREA